MSGQPSYCCSGCSLTGWLPLAATCFSSMSLHWHAPSCCSMWQTARTSGLPSLGGLTKWRALVLVHWVSKHIDAKANNQVTIANIHIVSSKLMRGPKWICIPFNLHSKDPNWSLREMKLPWNAIEFKYISAWGFYGSIIEIWFGCWCSAYIYIYIYLI